MDGSERARPLASSGRRALVTMWHGLVFSFLCTLCANGQKPLGATPPMGWNSWNKFQCDINEELIKRTADTLVSTGLLGLGYEYLVVDDCWTGFRDDNGTLHPNADQFPSGMKSLGEYIHSKGLKFGIHSSAGTQTCNHRPASLFFEKEDANLFASWGVDYVKYDNCYDEGVPTFERFKTMSDALRATGRDIFFALCEWGLEDPAIWAPALGNSWRSTADIVDTWPIVSHNFWYTEPWFTYNRPGSWNDPDMLEIGVHNGMSFVQQRSHFSLWAVTKSPLLLGTDVLDMSPETIEIITNKEVIVINQDPLGLPALRRGDPLCGAGLHVFAGPLANGDIVVALFMYMPYNWCTSPGPGALILWEKIGFPPSAQLRIRDLWKHEDIGVFTGSYTHNVSDFDGYSTVVLRVTPLDGASHSLMKDYEESHYTGGSDTTLVEELARKDTEIDLLRKKLEEAEVRAEL